MPIERVGRHEFRDGALFCAGCGLRREALNHAPETSCAPQATLVADRPRPRTSAVDDLDAIHEGIQRLRREQDAALSGENT